jgi:hypothetical protein
MEGHWQATFLLIKRQDWESRQAIKKCFSYLDSCIYEIEVGGGSVLEQPCFN